MARKLLAIGLETGLGASAVMVRRRDSDGAWWNTAGTPAFEAYNPANIANYAIPTTEDGATGTYSAPDPAEAVLGLFYLVKRAGVALAVADLITGLRYEGAAGPGSIAITSFGQSALDQLIGRVIVLRSPLVQGGHLEIVQGDGFEAEDDTALVWTNLAGDWPDLTGATIWMEVESGPVSNPTGTVVGDGSVVVPSGVGQQVKVEIPDDETPDLTRGPGRYLVRATLTSGNTKTLVIGTCEVIKRIITPAV